MNGKKGFALLVCLLLCGVGRPDAFGGDWQVGIGLNAGISRLEGDLKNPKLSPLISGHLRVLPLPYLALDGELGFSQLASNSHPNLAFTDFKTTIVPFELSVMFNFMPFSRINPYVFVGGGGVYWKAEANSPTGTIEDNFDSFLKTGGGLEFRVSRRLGINIGASFRLSLTDNFDQINQGNEDDQVLDAHAGFTFYLGGQGNDEDHDRIPDELDLMPNIAEDRDGYLDHDGIPEKNPSPLAMNSFDAPVGSANGSSSPIVIHHLVATAESGRGVLVKAHVFSDQPLKAVATLYRPLNTRKWNVVKLEDQGQNLYTGEIPGYAVTTEGFEYCVVAVDETLSGVGYSGLPNKPIRVKVASSGTLWRIIGGTVGAAAIGTASYLVLKKQ
ncbi:MAG: outer membrane beta-barrel protein [bacterium]